LHLYYTAGNEKGDVKVPRNAYLGVPEWAQESQHFAFTNTTPSGIELWVGQKGTYTANVVPTVKVNTIMGEAVQWMPDGKTLLVQTVPATRGKAPVAPKSPDGPIIQESEGKRVEIGTYEDLLQNSYDEALFDYYAKSQLVLSNKGVFTPVGKPGI